MASAGVGAVAFRLKCAVENSLGESLRLAKEARSTEHATTWWLALGAVGGGIYGFASGLVHGVGDGLDLGFSNMRKLQLHVRRSSG